jgi:hypothetical protein
LVRLPSLKKPTAHASDAESALTALSELPWVPPGLGLADTFQDVPFQRRTRVCSDVPLKNEPTAQAAVGERALTPFSRSLDPGLGTFGEARWDANAEPPAVATSSARAKNRTVSRAVIRVISSIPLMSRRSKDERFES